MHYFFLKKVFKLINLFNLVVSGDFQSTEIQRSINGIHIMSERMRIGAGLRVRKRSMNLSTKPVEKPSVNKLCLSTFLLK